MQVDLLGNFIDAQNSTIMPNGLKIDFSIANTGSDNSAAFDVDFYLSTDEQISTTTDDYLGSYRVLTGVEGSSTSELYTIYSQVPSYRNQSGNYYIGMVIDFYQEVAETDETNNSNQNLEQDYDLININIDQVDLIGKSLTIVNDKISNQDETLKIDFRISNLATQNSGNFNTDFYLSSDNIITPADTYLGTYEVSPGIAGNNTSEVLRADFQLPDNWEKEGKYYLGMNIDSQKEVPEINEDNNRNQGLNIDYGLVEIDFIDVDLVAKSFNIIKDEISVKEEFTVDFSISNQETKASKSFEVDFYLSDNEFISEQDTYLGTYTVERPIVGNDSTDILTTNLKLPDDWQPTGTYYLGMVVDGKEQIIETNENNNRNQGLAIDYEPIEIVDIVEPNSGIDDEEAFLIGTNSPYITHDLIATEEIFALGNEIFI